MRKTRLFASVGALALVLALISPAYAATTSSTFFLTQKPGYPDTELTFSGVISPKVKNAIVQIDTKLPKGWTDTKLRTRSTSSGAWTLKTRVTAAADSVSYRAKIYIGKRVFVTKSKTITIKQLPEINLPEQLIDRKSTRLNSSHVSESRMPSSA